MKDAELNKCDKLERDCSVLIGEVARLNAELLETRKAHTALLIQNSHLHAHIARLEGKA